MLTGISGSKQVFSWSQACCSTLLPASSSTEGGATGVSPMASASLPSMRTM